MNITRRILFCLGTTVTVTCTAGPLQERLEGESPEHLAAAARALGDAKRGAALYYSPSVGCATCHNSVDATASLGPSLTNIPKATEDVDLVRSVLYPSDAIREGYRMIQVLTVDGRLLAGRLIRETQKRIELLPADKRETVGVARQEIDEMLRPDRSLMPDGQVDTLADRQEFLDLIKYLIEIRDGGVERESQLRPAPGSVALRIPEYEQRIDHAGFIRDWDKHSLRRGREIYESSCVNCHGNDKVAGSLPTAPRFAEYRFRFGGDPHSMYRTLTHGGGLMLPQIKLVPRQKYDVIHYIHQKFLRRNPAINTKVTDQYLASLPTGNTRGPEPSEERPWSDMNYGSLLSHTFEVGDDGKNFAYKGVAVRLDDGEGGISRGDAWTVFDHDTMRVAANWTGEKLIDWQGIQFNGRHQIHPRIVGDVLLQNPSGPGWANPETDSFDDSSRVLGRDGRRYGPLPKRWSRYDGLYRDGDQVTFSYSVGKTEVLERTTLIRFEHFPKPVFVRRWELTSGQRPLRVLIASGQGGWTVRGNRASCRDNRVHLSLVNEGDGPFWDRLGDRLTVVIPPNDDGSDFAVLSSDARLDELPESPANLPVVTIPKRTTAQANWPEKLPTRAIFGMGQTPHAAFVADGLTRPDGNPWQSRLRFTGFDFHEDGDTMVACTWDGDVWQIEGLASLDSGGTNELRSRRIAAGLFQPLGLKIVEGEIYLTCRDQMTVLEDRNADGEADFYRCFNNDHQVTEHFHEFAMGLQRDRQGSWYYAKSARHALEAIVPHHGTLLRVAPDGSQTEIVATGFRAANGVCVNQDGSFIVTDQEGHWNPKNRINWVHSGDFYGNMFGYHDQDDPSDEAMRQPLAWITNGFDRSPAELLWVDSEKWGALDGSLLNLSYGYGRVYVVPHETIDGQKQGGMCALPIIDFPTGIIRGRFHPHDKQLYLCGMFAWAGSRQARSGGLYRLRPTGKPAYLPIKLNAKRGRIEMLLTDGVDPQFASDPDHYEIESWSLRRTAQYGSDHYDERRLPVRSARCGKDGKQIILEIPDLQPTWCMSIRCQFKTADGNHVTRVIHNTIHHLAD